MRIFAVATIAAALLLPMSASADPVSIDSVIDSSYSAHGLSDLALSPDGSHVVYVDTVRNIQSPTDPSPHGAILIQSTNGGTVKRLTAGNGKRYDYESSPIWSPDGTSIAFFSDARTPGQLQIYVARADGSAITPLTQLKGDVQGLQWSPDGKQLSFLYIENAPADAGPLAAHARDAGVVQSIIYEQRLATVDVATSKLRLLSPADCYIYEYSWAPDQHALAVSYAKGDGDNNWWIAKLATLETRSGALTDLYAPKSQFADPTWSPDGTSIAFIEGLMSDEGSTGGDVYLIPASGGVAHDITPKFEGSAAAISYIGHSNTLLMTYHREGSIRVAKLDTVNGSRTTVIDDATAVAFGTQLSENGSTIAYIYQSFSQPSEIFAGPVTSPKQLTHANANVQTFWGPARSLRWTTDGGDVQGWLLAPKHVDPAKTYPMVVMIHGGPAASNLAFFPSRQTAALTSQGYYVFMPNPRGSFGEGEAFTMENVKDFGYGDFRDILAGVDAAIKAAPIDPNRVGIAGWSYGGYMAMWAPTQTNRFKASVAGAGLSNWQSYYGENGIDQWMIPYFGASVYDDPAVYARSSPIAFIKNTKTPTLVLHGEFDTEVPAPQGYEYWHALKTLGVPTELVIYPNEGHGIARPADQKDIARRMVAWFDEYLK